MDEPPSRSCCMSSPVPRLTGPAVSGASHNNASERSPFADVDGPSSPCVSLRPARAALGAPCRHWRRRCRRVARLTLPIKLQHRPQRDHCCCFDLRPCSVGHVHPGIIRPTHSLPDHLQRNTDREKGSAFVLVLDDFADITWRKLLTGQSSHRAWTAQSSQYSAKLSPPGCGSIPRIARTLSHASMSIPRMSGYLTTTFP